MSAIKEDVKATVKVFIRILASIVVRESTKKIIKNLTERQRKKLEDKTKDMSDDQLAQYFDKNPFFKNALENAVKSVGNIQSAKETATLMGKLQSIFEETFAKNLIKVFIWPSPRAILAMVASTALLATVAVPLAIDAIYVPKLPAANFSSNVKTGYAPLSVQFTDESQNATKWNWEFGDGYNSTERNPTHTYSLAGNYNVSLTAANKKGKDSKIAAITVLEQRPVANFSSSATSGYVPLPVQFTDHSQNATGWNWDFGDGTNSTEHNPKHTYSAAGSYPVILTVTNGNSTNSKLAIITAQGNPVFPVANFSSSSTRGNVPLSVRFTDLSQNATGWNWDFGDGMNSTLQNSIHIYSSIGTYTVKLTATNANGTDSKLAIVMALRRQESIQGGSILPVANFSSNVTRGNVPLSVRFTDLSQNALRWNWNFGDGTISAQQNPTHTYFAAGNYTVSLTAANANGTDSNLAIIMVQEQQVLPVANFSSNVTSGNYPLTVQFFDHSENAISRSWNFGDGTNSIEKNPVHTYFSARNYPVSLTVTNVNGTNSTFAHITVLEEPVFPVADFNSDITAGLVPLSIQFTDLSKNATVWNWDFGDGTNTKERNPTHIYSAAGIYTANLTASNENGTDSKVGIITVLEQPVPPVANFNSDVSSGYAPLSVRFTDSSKDATQWNWNFGDGTNSTERNPTHTYSEAGTFNVSLIASNKNGTASKSDTITVSPALIFPLADFSVNVTSGHAPLYVQFTDHSDNATSWKWDFGDGTNSTEQDPAHTYSLKGTYIVSLIAINRNGTDSELATINVLQHPVYAYVTNYGSKTVSVINTSDNTTYTVNVGEGPAKIAVSPDGTKVYVANQYEDTVSIINSSDSTTYKVNVDGPEGRPEGITVSPDGTKVYVANQYRDTVSVINTSDYTTHTVNVGNSPREIVISPDGTKVYVANLYEGTVSVINTSDYTTYTMNVGTYPYGVAVSPDGTKVYVANAGSNNVSVINTSDYTTYTVNVGEGPSGIAVSPDGTKVYVANSGSDNVSVINTSDYTTYMVNVGDEPSGIAVSPDGTRVYVVNLGEVESSDEDTVSVIDVATNKTVTVPVGTNPDGIAVSPDGTKVYVANSGSDNVSVINTSDYTTYTVNVGTNPVRVAVAQR